MYGYIIGKITKITPKYIIVENNGIGYILIVPNPYIFNLNEEYKIFTHQYVRDDAIELYGFKTEPEKDLFLKLISVSGIGPKSALSILATGEVKEIIKAIESRNDAYLRKFPGIGSKASLQIILDLKGKLDFNENEESIVPRTSKMDDVEHNKKEISKVLGKLDVTLDEGKLIKLALQQMVK